jgi:drug/metabolite transporter (DMT)-like permease
VSRKGWLLFGSLCVIWGIPYLLIRVAVEELSPPTLVFFRTAPAALLLIPLAMRQGTLRSLLPQWPWVLAYTAAEVTIPWLLLSHAEVRLSSSMAGLLIATVPLLGAVIYRFFGNHDPLDARRLIGLLIGFAGVAALVGIDFGQVDMWAVGEVGIVVLGYTFGPLIVSKKLADLPSLWVVVVSLALTAVIYSPMAMTHLPTAVSGKVIASMAILVVVCTALAFYLFFDLIKEVGPARSTVVTYVNPAVAILGGVLLLGEPFTLGIAIGFPLVLIGSVLGTASSKSPGLEPAADEVLVEPPAS